MVCRRYLYRWRRRITNAVIIYAQLIAVSGYNAAGGGGGTENAGLENAEANCRTGKHGKSMYGKPEFVALNSTRWHLCLCLAVG